MEPIYVDIADEITTVIERLKAASGNSVALVVPKGGALAQSIVNLKLAKRAADEAGKTLTLVTTDKIGRNLAAQVGLASAASLEGGASPETQAAPAEDGPEPQIIDGVKVSRYYQDSDAAPATDADAGPLPAPIIPKAVMKEAEPEAPRITVRQVKQEVPGKPEARELEGAQMAADTVPMEDTAPPAVPPIPAAIPEPSKAAKPASPVALPMEAPKRRRKLVPLLALLIVLCLLGAAGAGAFYFPKTAVAISIPAQSWEDSLTVTATVGGTPAAELVTATSDETLIFKASGSKETGNKAQGTATVFNSGSDVQQLPAGSKIVADGISFTTQAEARVPAGRIQNGQGGAQFVAGSVNVAITADAPGDTANLSAVTASVTDHNLLAQVTATGGTSKKVAVITQADIAAAKSALEKQAKDSIANKMAAELQDRDVLFDADADAFSFDGFSSSQAADTQADSATASASVTLKRLVADKSAILQAAAAAEKARQSADTTYQTDGATIGDYSVSSKDASITATVASKGRKAATVDTASLRGQLKGKTSGSGQDILKAAVREGTITVSQSPQWWPIRNFPYSDKFLTVTVTYE